MRWLASLLVLLLSATTASALEKTADEGAIETALELRLRLEELLAKLSPEARAEFERRWAEARQSEARSAEAEPGGRTEAEAPARAAPGLGKGSELAEPSALSEAETSTSDNPLEPSAPTSPESPEPDSEPEPVAQKSSEPARPQLEPVIPAAPEASTPRPPPAPQEQREHSCNTLYVLDSNDDGVISGADRFWRYLGLWIDNGDGLLEEDEVESLFKLRVRKVSARLYSYTTAKDADGGIWVEDRIYFDLPGRGRRSRAALTLNASGLGRSDDSWVEDAAGKRLEGLVAIESGVAVATVDGDRHSILCR